MLRYKASEDGFMGLSPADAGAPEDARAVIVPFGLEASVSYEGGTAKGPQAILDASPELEYFDEVFWAECFRDYGIATLEEPTIADDLLNNLNALEETVDSILEQNQFPLILGGEHSLTAGAIRPFSKRFEEITILQFDAHADLRDGYLGQPYSHAAAMRRCLDHENVRLVSVGIRNISAEEIPFLDANTNRIEMFWMKDHASWTPRDVARAVGSGPVYISFDVDGFDSSLMPATGTPEPGGLFWAEVMETLQHVSETVQIVGADVVELAPRAGLHACDFVAAKLCYKILNYALCSKKTKP